MGTFYNDAFMGLSLGCLVVGLTMLVDPNLVECRKAALVIVAAAFILCTGSKFTGLAYAGVFTVAFSAVVLTLRLRRVDGFDTRSVARIAGVFVFMLIFSMATVGASSYCKNTLEKGNPFYPLAGEEKVDIITYNEPPSFQRSSNIRKLAYATFSESSNFVGSNGSHTEPKLKALFTVSQDEIAVLSRPDPRMGGFGVFTGGIFLLAVPLYLAMLIWAFRRKRALFGIGVAYGAVTLALILFISDSWWARYSPYLWGIVVFAVAFCCLIIEERIGCKNKECRRLLAKSLLIFPSLLLAVVFTNMCFWLNFGVYQNLLSSAAMYERIDSIENTLQEDSRLVLQVAFSTRPGPLLELEQRGILYTIVSKTNELEDADGRLVGITYQYA